MDGGMDGWMEGGFGLCKGGVYISRITIEKGGRMRVRESIKEKKRKEILNKVLSPLPLSPPLPFPSLHLR